MKRKDKKVFLTYWFYIFAFFITLLLFTSFVAFCIIYLCTVSVEVNPTVPTLYYLTPIAIIMAAFMISVSGYYHFQMTILTPEGVKSRCLWCTIRELKWEEVKEVRLQAYYISVQGGFVSGWFVFDDGEEKREVNGLMSKKTHIVLRYNKRTKAAVEKFCKDKLVVKEMYL